MTFYQNSLNFPNLPMKSTSTMNDYVLISDQGATVGWNVYGGNGTNGVGAVAGNGGNGGPGCIIIQAW